MAHHLLSTVMVSVLYAVAMGVDALAALGTGWLYDRIGPRILTVLPVLAAAVLILAFADRLALAITGTLVWGRRGGCANLVPVGRRATAYGLFAAIVATLAGGAVAGILYAYSVPALIMTTIAIQAAVVLLLAATRTP